MLSFLSFSLTRFIFSRYFGFRFLKCKVDSVEKLNSFNFINAFAILVFYYLNLVCLYTCMRFDSDAGLSGHEARVAFHQLHRLLYRDCHFRFDAHLGGVERRGLFRRLELRFKC